MDQDVSGGFLTIDTRSISIGDKGDLEIKEINSLISNLNYEGNGKVKAVQGIKKITEVFFWLELYT